MLKVLIFIVLYYIYGLSLSTCLLYVFTYTFGRDIFTICYWLYKLNFRLKINLLEKYGKNSWALITNVSDNLGKELCIELAKSGLNLILIDKDLNKLANVIQDIKFFSAKTEIETIIYDFNKEINIKEFLEVFKEIKTYDISILVNNIGRTLNSSFDTADIKELEEMIKVNVKGHILITKLLLSNVSVRNMSAIINITSGICPIPNDKFAMYTATKQVEDFLSRSLHEEYKGKIDILTVRPFKIKNLTEKASLFSVSVEEFTNSIMSSIGHDKITYGPWKHQVIGYLITLIPESISLKLFF